MFLLTNFRERRIREVDRAHVGVGHREEPRGGERGDRHRAGHCCSLRAPVRLRSLLLLVWLLAILLVATLRLDVHHRLSLRLGPAADILTEYSLYW